MPTTTNLPAQPNFPAQEEAIQAFWVSDHTFEKSVEQRPADKEYVFYDGPPFATGLPHYGHLLASTIKDVVPRYWTMKGYRVNRVWGWDCHGLPIENMIENKLEIKGGKKGIEALGIDRFNQACRAEVLRLDTEWEKIIGRLGRWVDFANNYKTMDSTFMESVWWGFQQLMNKDLVYEGRKVILYCSRCATPLSNFEIAMDNSYKEVTDRGTTYKYQVLAGATRKKLPNTYFLAWSTTPWNKLATPALAVNPTLQYVKVEQAGEYYLLAETTLSRLKDLPYTVLEHYTGSQLEEFGFEPHYDFFAHERTTQRSGVIVADEFVTAEDGTGIVTLAAYGEDDYRVMQQHNIQVIEHVDDQGRLKAEVTPWAGTYLLKANPVVNEDLMARGLIYQDEPHTHSVPTCYRCGTQLYHAPLPAWFINTQRLKPDLISLNEDINWYPEHLKHGRFKKGLENAPDWNISRSRYWGTPMPIWRERLADGSYGKALRVVGSVAELKQWAVDPAAVENLTDIHREFIDEIELWLDDAKTIKGRRIPEVFDCWVESGSMPFAAIHYPFANKETFEHAYPAQFVSEYIAQTRAWFYTMHVMSVGIFGKPPFENVVTTGTILAEDGAKMSKSKKNYPDPMLLINQYGVDSLRLYLMSTPVMRGENLNFSEKDVSDIRRRVFVIWWNVLSFYLSFANHSVGFSKPTSTPTHVLDAWLLSRVEHLVSDVTTQLDAYDVVRASRSLMEFVDELSTWYIRLSRERIKAENNQETSQVLGYALYTLAQLFAPFAPFFTEFVHHTMVDQKSSIHLTDWPTAQAQFVNTSLEESMAVVRLAVEKAHAVRKDQALKVRQPLAAVTVSSNATKPSDELLSVMAQELNVKSVIWQSAETLSVALDTTLTPELIAEGEARELMRSIQKLRKEAGLKLEDTATVTAPRWPEAWQSEIERKTHTTLIVGSELSLQV